jgi:hypothetical protein
MRNISDKRCRENQNTHFVLGNFFENHAVYEIKWKNIVERDRPHMKTRCLRISCWISKSTNTRSCYVIFSVFPRQKWSHERVSFLRYSILPVLLC